MSVTRLSTSKGTQTPAFDSRGSNTPAGVSRLADRLRKSDALDVVEAFECQALTRRHAYLLAPLGTPTRAAARRSWLEALEQLEAAEDALEAIIDAAGGDRGPARHVRHAARATAGIRPAGT